MSPKKKILSEIASSEISAKSTKDQILSAYNDVVAMLEEKRVQSPLEEKKKDDKKAIVMKASQTSSDEIVSHLATLKITLTKQIDTLSESLLKEFNKLSELRQAITIEQNHLQELYAIKETAHSLAALMLMQKEETEKFEREMKETRDQFEQEMGDKKALWDKKQAELEMSYAEKQGKLEIQRKREEEEYTYNLALARREEAQAYTLKQDALERELEDKRRGFAQKEALIDSRLAEMEGLQEKVQKFPEELARETERVVQDLTEKLESQHKFSVTLKEKEIEGEKKLYLQKIASLEAKVKEQDTLIAQLTQKANEASQQVQAIACKALEASSQRLSYSSYGEKTQELSQQRQEKHSS